MPSKPSGTVTLITKLVASDGPLLVTLVANPIESPKSGLVLFTSLLTTKLTTASTRTESELALSLDSFKSFSLALTDAVFAIVPLPISLVTKTNSLDSLLAKFPTVQTPLKSIPLPSTVAETSSTRLESSSLTFMPVAVQGPLLVTLIVYLMVSPTLALVELTALLMLKSTTGTALTESDLAALSFVLLSNSLEVILHNSSSF